MLRAHRSTQRRTPLQPRSPAPGPCSPAWAVAQSICSARHLIPAARTWLGLCQGWGEAQAQTSLHVASQGVLWEVRPASFYSACSPPSATAARPLASTPAQPLGAGPTPPTPGVPPGSPPCPSGVLSGPERPQGQGQGRAWPHGAAALCYAPSAAQRCRRNASGSYLVRVVVRFRVQVRVKVRV